jgi:putative two-component system response regulator
VLGRVEKRLARSQQKLLDEGLKREALQEEYVKELQTTVLETERAEEAALNMMEDAEMARSDLHDSFVEAIYTLMRAAEYRDDETGAHVKRISYYTRVLAEHMGMDEDFCDTIFYASPMHDIGKIGISDLILLKAGGFTPEEWEIMKTHAVMGGSILSGNTSPYLKMGEQIALGHHERWDGGGYPAGLKGDEIPLPARIMQLADVYDALRSRRPYKEPFTHEKTMQIICKGDGRTEPSHFDPAVLAAFEQCADQLADIFAQRSEPDEQ